MNHQKHLQEEIIIFTRYPQAGTTKTRLIPELGADGAAGMQRSMTELIVRSAGQFVNNTGSRLSIYFTGGSHQQMEQWLGPDLLYHEQVGDNLGQRLMRAFQDAWLRGSQYTVLIASDCPSIDGALISEAMAALRNNQLVLGPTVDGGYYLVGMSNDLPANALSLLFTDIAWGTQEVFQATLDRTRAADLTISILKKLHDIDHPKDLAHFRHHSDSQ